MSARANGSVGVGGPRRRMRMRLSVDGAVLTGRAVDCTDLAVAPEAILAAVRGSGGPVTVRCPDPGPVHEHVGHVGPETTLRARTALAALARARGLTAPQDDELADVRAELADVRAELAAMDPPESGVAAARERFASVDEAELASLREDVAATRGAVQARLELDADVEPAREALSEAVTELADAQTDRVAAEQLLTRARQRAREARAARRERLRLQDRVGNLERAARAHLAAELRDEFAAAVAAVPGEGGVSGGPTSFEGDDATAALAVTRMADLRAPVVLSGRWFESARAAARRLDVPVVRV